MGSRTRTSQPVVHGATNDKVVSLEARIAALEARVEELEAELRPARHVHLPPHRAAHYPGTGEES